MKRLCTACFLLPQMTLWIKQNHGSVVATGWDYKDKEVETKRIFRAVELFCKHIMVDISVQTHKSNSEGFQL